jgi:glucokinase
VATSRNERAVGVDLGGTKIFAALVARDGQVSDEIYVEHQGTAPPGSGYTDAEVAAGPAYARLCETITALLAHARARGETVSGIGAGAPGVAKPGGVIELGTALGWRELPLGALLGRRFGLPVEVENDVNLQALGEYFFGAGVGAQSLFLMAVGTGIGGGLVIDGKLVRGRHHAAGEIGLLVPGREHLGWSRTDWGAFESVASGTGVTSAARKLVGERGIIVSDEDLRSDRVFAAATTGVSWAREVVETTIDHLTVGVSAIQAVVDPEVVVIGGGVSAQADLIIPGLERRLAPLMPYPPRLAKATLGYHAGVLGAAALLWSLPRA